MSLRKDREAWWSDRASEMEAAAVKGNTRQLFHLIRITGTKKPGVSETICEQDGSPIYNMDRRLERWSQHFNSQFNWPSSTADPSGSTVQAPWPVSLDAPTESEIRREIQVLERHKAPDMDELPPALFGDGRDVLVGCLTSKYLAYGRSALKLERISHHSRLQKRPTECLRQLPGN